MWYDGKCGMMGSKLGIHIQDVVDMAALVDFCNRARPCVIKTMDRRIDELLARLTYRPVVIGRKYFDGQPLTDPRGIAKSIANDKLGQLCQQGIIDAMEGYNEISPHEGGQSRYLDWQLELVGFLTGYEIPYVADSWSVGQPDQLDSKKRMTYFDDPRTHELMRKAAFEGLHEYCAPTMWEPRAFDPQYTDKNSYITTGWYTLRYRKAYSQLRDFMRPEEIPPFLITECGIDSGARRWPVSVQGGYKSFCSIQDYITQLAWYDSQLQKDSYIVGATPFLFGTKDQTNWRSFDMWEHREQYRQYLETQNSQMGNYESHYVLLPQGVAWEYYTALKLYIETFRVTMGQSHDDAARVHGNLGHHVTFINPLPGVVDQVRQLTPSMQPDIFQGTAAQVRTEFGRRAREGRRFG